MLEYLIKRRKTAAGDEDGRFFDGLFAYTVRSTYILYLYVKGGKYAIRRKTVAKVRTEDGRGDGGGGGGEVARL
jgi:hypothetical protein